MKLEVGMYVRTNLGEIAKLIESRHFENETGNYNYLVTDKEIKKAIYDDQKNEHIIKASYNIIDLIEEGDYVNGSIVDDFYTTYNEETDSIVRKGVITNDCYLENSLNSWLEEKDIKSIITKEQFESMKYEVK